jgi:2-C-methyl-D-erythritol 2,4-cyclodiphosphate synthase
MKIGYGWDSHEFKPGIPLKIGGVTLPHTHGLGGHSDGDALLHAITDALLGAVAAPDIGSLFSPSDPKWKGADSALFLHEAQKRVTAAGYAICNVDSTLIMNAPKSGPMRMQSGQCGETSDIPPDWLVSKLKPRKIGTDNAAIAHAIVLLENFQPRKRPTRTRRSRRSKFHNGKRK